jgi:transposase
MAKWYSDAVDGSESVASAPRAVCGPTVVGTPCVSNSGTPVWEVSVDLANYCVNAVLVEGRSVRAVAAATGRSKSWVHRHVSLFRAGGEAALVPAKRGPKVAPRRTSAFVEDQIVALRKRLAEDGLDDGARTIHYHLALTPGAPSLSTIHRVLVRRGFVTPQPQKRPRASWLRFESALPNDTWLTDMTHWHLVDDQPVEIVNFIDD